jgi:diguanylate cyclase (GGDEF)-like protein/PAS domain S-box-containing protein
MRVFKAYALATLSVMIALLGTFAVPQVRQQFKFIFFVLAVSISATGGIWPGVFATLLSMALVDYFLIEPLYSISISGPGDLALWFLFTGVGLTITWITHRLHRSEEVARAGARVVEYSADSIIGTNSDNMIQSWNNAAEGAYGYTTQEAIGRPLSVIFPTDHVKELHDLTGRVRRGASFQNHEAVCVRKDGAHINVALTLSPVLDREGKFVAMSFIARDITEKKRAERALRDSLEKLRLLTEMGRMLEASSIPADAYAVAAHFAQELLPGASGTLYEYSTSTRNLAVVSRWGGLQTDEKELLAPDECWGLRTGHAHFVGESNTGLLCRHLPDPPPACYLCVPMIAHGETLGLLHFRFSLPRQASSRETPSQSGESPWPFTSIADQLALAVANMKLREALLSQSIRDPLTGWFNRRYMEETLEREIPRAARNSQPLTVIMLDVDNFKEFNDSFGHDAGDGVLQNLCATLTSHIRREDVACRYGGDEFVLILPDTPAELAAQRAEELRVAVASIERQHQGHLLAPLTLSFGIATYHENGRTLKDLLRACDTALFRAKSEGRNSVRSQERVLD